MMLGYFCALACAIPAGHIAVWPDSTIHNQGGQIGVYVDNEDPTQAQDIQAARQAGWKLVVAGIPPSDPGRRFPGGINALEWYPYWNGRRQWERLPPAEAYIVQWRFAWPGTTAPTKTQRWRLWHRAVRRHPQLVLRY